MMRYALSLLMLILLFSGCTPTTSRDLTTCSPFARGPLQALPFDGMPPHIFHGWVAKQYELGTADVHQSSKDETGDQTVYWQVSNKYYYAVFTNDILNHVTVEWEAGQDTPLGQIIDCMGSPTSYSFIQAMSAHGPRTTIYLWYEGQGWLLVGSELSTSIETERFPISGLYIADTASFEEMIDRVDIVTPERAALILQAAKQWPGAIEDMEPFVP